jgi:hypothetical protein
VKKDVIHAEKAAQAFSYLAELLRSDAALDRIIDAYIETRGVLASAFRQLAISEIGTDVGLISAARDRVQTRMRLLYSSVAPDELIYVRSYGETHFLLLAYLVRRTGRPVSSARLRLVSGDQVHTERRVRELRDLGYQISASKVAGEFQYVLESSDQLLDLAAAAQLMQNIKKSKTISEMEKYRLRAVLHLDQH